MKTNIDINSIECSLLKEEITQPDLQMKGILIGPASVGKSSLLNRAINDEFLSEIEPTVGIAFGVLNMQMNNLLVKMQVWDTAGSEQFRSVTKVFYKGSHTAFLVFDMTDENSFKQLEFWVNEVKKECPPNTPIILVGNKSDAKENRQVTKEAALQFMEDEKLNEYEETSAKSGENAQAIFINAAKKYFIKTKDTVSNLHFSNMNLAKGNQEEKGKCSC